MEPILLCRHVTHTFPDGNGGLQALNDLSFDVCPQEFVCVLGPSGCGKTTLLRLLAGLLSPTGGQVLFQGQPASAARTGFVFQSANLMPWRTVLQNILLPLELAGGVDDTGRREAAALIELVGLSGFEQAWPADLSGGMAQRVAIARALIHDPDILLLDEPFGALDALTRDRMGSELLRIWQAQRKTVVMVTHSISEAVLLADRVLVLTPRPGTLAVDQKINLPRPRVEEMRYSADFGRLAREIKGAISSLPFS
jgi:NitT/TauT family transport system ATP-binding protein